MEVYSLLKIHTSSMAQGTKRTYMRVFSEFSALVNKNYRDVDTDDLWKFVSYLRDKRGIQSRFSTSTEYSPKTIVKDMNCMRSFYRYLEDTKKIEVSPFRTFKLGINPRKAAQKLPTEAVTFQDVARILNHAFPNSREGIRDRAFFTILFATGIRRTEVAKLSLCDYKVSEEGTSFLCIRFGKGGTYRQQALAEWAIQPILDLIEHRKREGADLIDPLLVCYDRFGTPYNRHVSDKTIYDIFKIYATKFGLKNISPHSARRTVCTKLLHDGHDYKAVQNVMGHASTQMVELYDKRIKNVDNSAAKNLSY